MPGQGKHQYSECKIQTYQVLAMQKEIYNSVQIIVCVHMYLIIEASLIIEAISTLVP